VLWCQRPHVAREKSASKVAVQQEGTADAAEMEVATGAYAEPMLCIVKATGRTATGSTSY